LNAKEQQRAMVLNQVERRELTGQQAAALVGLSLRQVRRLLAGCRKEGAAALAHGNRGRPPVHRLPEECREQVVALAQGRYLGLNHHHLQELLVEREQLALIRSSVWHPDGGGDTQPQAAPAAPASLPKRALPPGGDVATGGWEPP